jgi:hypothetical protein
VVAGAVARSARVRQVLIELHPASCDANAVVSHLAAAFPFAYRLARGHSQKPLVLWTRELLNAPAPGLTRFP